MAISYRASENTKEELEEMAKDGYYPNKETNRMERREVCIRIGEDILPPDCEVVFTHKDAPMDMDHLYFTAHEMKTGNKVPKYNGKYGLVLHLSHESLKPVPEGENSPIVLDIGSKY